MRVNLWFPDIKPINMVKHPVIILNYFKELGCDTVINGKLEDTDVLFLPTFGIEHINLIDKFKNINPDGKVFVRLDLGKKYFKLKNGCGFYYPKFKPVGWFFNKLYLKDYLKLIDFFSIENEEMKELLLEKHPLLEGKLFVLPPAVSSKEMKKVVKRKRSWSQKENLVVSVARFGSEQKNSFEMLEIVRDSLQKGWKFIGIGNFTEEFRLLINLFNLENPHLQYNVDFVGEKSHDEVLKILNKSKIFILPSNWESLPTNAVSEALYFNNLVVTYDDEPITHDLGFFRVPTNDKDSFKECLKDLQDADSLFKDEEKFIVEKDYKILKKVIK